jgi:hypothetical protein
MSLLPGKEERRAYLAFLYLEEARDDRWVHAYSGPILDLMLP